MNWTYHAAVRGPDAAPATCRTPELAGLLSRWRDDLASWAIPEHILDSVAEAPWVLPGKVFARRPDRLSADPARPSSPRPPPPPIPPPPAPIRPSDPRPPSP